MLINSLSKSERKKITSTLDSTKTETDYFTLYKSIDSNQNNSESAIISNFKKKRPNASLNTAVSYLFDTILTLLKDLKSNNDIYFLLLNKLMYVRILFEKSIYQECFQLLAKVQEEAFKFENYPILLIAQKMELDYLLILDFLSLKEHDLLSKQHKVNETIKIIRKINEHASLYELLKHRTLHKGMVRSDKHKQEFNDLIVSEMSIISSFGLENFEIQKNHKLFQSNYLINVGDYKSALTSFYELNNIFEQNKHLLSSPPIYYLTTIEGILDSLRTIKNYEGLKYFNSQLENLETNSDHFRIQVQCVIFLNTLFPLLDTGKFIEAKELINNHKENLYDKANLLIQAKQAQLSLYTAITYLGVNDFTKAKKTLSQIITSGKNNYSPALFRTIRLVNYLILYELNDFDFIAFESRSIKREIQNKEKTYRIELLILSNFNKPINNLDKTERNKLWLKLEPKLLEFQNDKFELQLLKTFDFTAWIEAKVKNSSLSDILKQKSQQELNS